MSESTTKVTSESFIERIGKSIGGVVFGILCILIAFPVLFLNEGRSVKRYKTLKEGQGAVIEVPSESVDQANNGELIHISGSGVSEGVLEDSYFGASVEGFKLQRTVEMYQWKETESSTTRNKAGGGTETVTEYSYTKVWSSEMISSTSFEETSGHMNPMSIPYESNNWSSSKVTVGAFELASYQINSISGYETISPLDLGITSSDLSYDMSIEGNYLYEGRRFSSPEVGDVRISYRGVENIEEKSSTTYFISS